MEMLSYQSDMDQPEESFIQSINDETEECYPVLFNKNNMSGMAGQLIRVSVGHKRVSVKPEPVYAWMERKTDEHYSHGVMLDLSDNDSDKKGFNRNTSSQKALASRYSKREVVLTIEDC